MYQRHLGDDIRQCILAYGYFLYYLYPWPQLLRVRRLALIDVDRFTGLLLYFTALLSEILCYVVQYNLIVVLPLCFNLPTIEELAAYFCNGFIAPVL